VIAEDASDNDMILIVRLPNAVKSLPDFSLQPKSLFLELKPKIVDSKRFSEIL
jgi:hypothetical protein